MRGTTPSKCDLYGCAKAGHASMVLDCEDLNDYSRVYTAPGPRVQGKPGEIRDNHRFARFGYEWGRRTYIMYGIEYTE